MHFTKLLDLIKKKLYNVKVRYKEKGTKCRKVYKFYEQFKHNVQNTVWSYRWPCFKSCQNSTYPCRESLLNFRPICYCIFILLFIYLSYNEIVLAQENLCILNKFIAKKFLFWLDCTKNILENWNYYHFDWNTIAKLKEICYNGK